MTDELLLSLLFCYLFTSPIKILLLDREMRHEIRSSCNSEVSSLKPMKYWTVKVAGGRLAQVNII